jgi:hypothetical protein
MEFDFPELSDNWDWRTHRFDASDHPTLDSGEEDSGEVFEREAWEEDFYPCSSFHADFVRSECEARPNSPERDGGAAGGGQCSKEICVYRDPTVNPLGAAGVEPNGAGALIEIELPRRFKEILKEPWSYEAFIVLRKQLEEIGGGVITSNKIFIEVTPTGDKFSTSSDIDVSKEHGKIKYYKFD